jgi:large subunit ribosomal protein L3
MRTCANLAEPSFSSLLAFKAGMTHVCITDTSEAPSKGQEIARAATLIVFPKIFIYGIRLYRKNYLYKQPSSAVYDKNLAQKVGIKNTELTSLEAAKKGLKDCDDVAALAFADPSGLKIGIKHPIRFELPVGGSDAESKFAFLEKWLGKEVKPGDLVGVGEFIDVLGISKGKGWAGVIKRFGVARQYHKSTNKIRHVGCLGAWHPPKVLFSVPMAGHMGYNYRTELNKKVLKMGSPQEAVSLTSSGGLLHFGNINGDFALLDGSVPGPAKRLLRVRKAVRATAKPTEVKLTYISAASKQGA